MKSTVVRLGSFAGAGRRFGHGRCRGSAIARGPAELYERAGFRPGSVDDWTAATLNYPLTTGDHLWTDPAGERKCTSDPRPSAWRPKTALAFLNLDDRTVQISLTQGTLNVHLRFLAPDEVFEVDTPSVSVSLLRPGDYRIDADGEHNLAAVAVRGGEAEVGGGGAAFTVHPRESARISGLESVSQEIGPPPPPEGSTIGAPCATGARSSLFRPAMWDAR